MTPQMIRRLGRLAYAQTLRPRRADRKARKVAILGFDTECDAQTSELISLQITHDGAEEFIEWPAGQRLEWEDLYQRILAFLQRCDVPISFRKLQRILLVSYFSLADAQHLDLISRAIRIDEWGAANYDFTWIARAKKRKVSGREVLATDQSVRIVDLQTWFRRQSLADAAKSFGAGEKLSWARDKISRKDLADPGFRQYAVNDAHLAERIFRRLRDLTWEKYTVDVALTRTPASTSMSIFRRRYLRTDYTNRNCRLRRTALLCAWGGNNQAFVRGLLTGRFYEYDAVSMYPSSVVALGVLPNERDWRRERTLDQALRPVRRGGFCHVRFTFPQGTAYPCLPVFVRGALVYPLEGETFCTLAEVRAAVALGADLELIEAYTYATGGDEFSRYMLDQMRLKDQAEVRGDGAGRALHKLYMNAVIGKLAQRRMNYDLNDAKRIAEERMIPLHDLLSIPNLLQQVRKKVLLGSGWYPEWNALILGYARAALSLAFAKTQALVGTTDSLICESEQGENFLINGIRFKLQGTGDWLKVVRTRLYLLREGERIRHIAYHGVHGFQNGVRLLDRWRNDFEDEYRYSRTHIVKVREAFKTQRRPGETETREFSTALRWDNKRRLGEDGRTTAWTCAEQMITEAPDSPEVLWQLVVIERTCRDALDFGRPGRYPSRDPETGEQTGEWYGIRAALPSLDPDLASTFKGKSPRDLLDALHRRRGKIYGALRQFAVERAREYHAWTPASPAR